VVAAALLEGRVYAQYDKASPELQQWLRQGQPNCFLPLDRSGVDPFVERWPVTLRCEGTVRGVGGIRLTGDDCSTGVPGLYAAGDAASRERLTGAVSGGGGPNSSWAIASGNWAGSAAAALIAASRWAYRSALARAESRGMYRRTDRPVAEPDLECLFEVSGLGSVRVERRAVGWSTAA
jgi:succinate dehydrogenase/fumarate reductase flavoprotein subunit